MVCVGDIVKLFAPQAGHIKYHLCVCVGQDGNASKFLYLNSDPSFDGTYCVDCARVPCIPLSATNKTVFSFAIVLRYNDRQLALYKAETIGSLKSAACVRITFVRSAVRTLNGKDKTIVLDALSLIKNRASPTASLEVITRIPGNRNGHPSLRWQRFPFFPHPHARLIAVGELDAGGIEGSADSIDCSARGAVLRARSGLSCLSTP